MAQIDVAHDEGRAIRVTLTFDKDDVQIDETPMGVRVTVTDCHNIGLPGAPALPRRTVRVALPVGMWPEPAIFDEGKTVVLTRKPTLVEPAQPLQPGVPPDSKAQRNSKHRAGRDRPSGQDPDPACTCCQCECCAPQDPGGAGEDIGYDFEHFPAPAPVLPDEDLYDEIARDRAPVVLRSVHQSGPNPLVELDIRPVRYTDKGGLELIRELTVTIPYIARPRERASTEQLRAILEKLDITHIDPERLQPLPEPVLTSKAQAKRYADLVRDMVVNPELVNPSKWDDTFIDRLPADYLIITDNQRWNADTIAPTGPLLGDMVAQFERLAQHKFSRGVTARVVTIADIVGGRYGDFRTGSRDLPEVIRRFLKDVHRRWGVAWVLLGGDVDVVPARYVAGALEGHMDVATTDPPAANTSFWTGTHLKMHVVNPGTWWPGAGARTLINAGTGQLIPFDATGATATSGLGWYWTTDDYSTRSATPTNHVRVNGTAGVLNARLQWIYQWNSIPTDLYYSSLQGWAVAYHEISIWLTTVKIPYVFQPAHDWDALDNGLYGQYVGGEDIDGVHWQTDVSVGRAPVQTGNEAQAFVDKVIAYANYNEIALMPDATWTRRVLIASANWGSGTRIFRTLTNPPENNRFLPGASVAVIHLADMRADFDWQLIAEISDSDRRELPYNETSSPTSRGWHYAVSATDHSVPMFRLSLLSFEIEFPIPSNWIVVHGPAAELNPPTYLFDHALPDGSMADQEQLRVQLADDLPSWSSVTRLYEDLTDLTPAEAAATPLGYLTSPRLQSALNADPHIVSLSGHGNPDGCCAGSVWMAGGLTNGRPGFIGYADSCLTGASDSEDSFAEALLKHPNGGAVAYVGNTRFSWISLGDDVQRAFFKKLTRTRHLGLLNDCRIFAVDFGYLHAYARWMALSLTLFGDPEMRVWRTPPRSIWPKIRWRKPDFRVPVEVELPKPPRPDPPYQIDRTANYLVHVAQAGFQRTITASPGEVVSVDISGAEPGELTLAVTYLGDGDHAPYVQSLYVEGPTWVSGRVATVSYRDKDRPWTELSLETTDGVRRLVVVDETKEIRDAADPDALADRADHDLCVQAVVTAHTAETPIALMVDRRGDGARVERFRLPG
ncbi:C25 family cysteine peptidase [Mycolicibacterium boenickei]